MYKLSDIAGEVKQDCASCSVDASNDSIWRDPNVTKLLGGHVRPRMWSNTTKRWVELRMIIVPETGFGAVFDPEMGVISDDNEWFLYFKEEMPSLCERFDLLYKDDKKAICYYE